ncbi:hypothetical protein B0J18DRAFT_259136 [Chaetomium sp. MPI-SDFR-AT-0129]|nr:hypothetical protein B0J18DRAFT_259136 [Chaetomium sp. MPI-SDFR-AT-0129]
MGLVCVGFGKCLEYLRVDCGWRVVKVKGKEKSPLLIDGWQLQLWATCCLPDAWFVRSCVHCAFLHGPGHLGRVHRSTLLGPYARMQGPGRHERGTMVRHTQTHELVSIGWLRAAGDTKERQSCMEVQQSGTNPHWPPFSPWRRRPARPRGSICSSGVPPVHSELCGPTCGLTIGRTITETPDPPAGLCPALRDLCVKLVQSVRNELSGRLTRVGSAEQR